MTCKTCEATESPKWYGGGSECRACYAKRRHKKIYNENPEYFRKRMADYRSRAPNAIKSNQLMTSFGISLEDYQNKLVAQGGTCAICKSSSPGRAGVRYFSVDHCHDTGKIRDLLCARCNTGIGLLQDNPEILDIAAKYLRRHGK